jgi:hypothetical protein
MREKCHWREGTGPYGIFSQKPPGEEWSNVEKKIRTWPTTRTFNVNEIFIS